MPPEASSKMTCQSGAGRRSSSSTRDRIVHLFSALIILSRIPPTEALHHMAVKAPRSLQPRKEPVTPLLVTNYCPETVWPGISTQSGDGPRENGFELTEGSTYNQTVSEDWQGRVWGRTNCSFNDDGTAPRDGSGRACRSGDCNGILNCQVGVSGCLSLLCVFFQFPLTGTSRAMSLFLLQNSLSMPGTDIHTTTYHWSTATTFPWQ
jgi:hypothetical protein